MTAVALKVQSQGGSRDFRVQATQFTQWSINDHQKCNWTKTVLGIRKRKRASVQYMQNKPYVVNLDVVRNSLPMQK